MTRQERLREIRERVNAATEGPWDRDGYEVVCQGGYVLIATVDEWISDEPPGKDIGKADAEFIAHARADVPWLVAELEAVTARETRLRQTVQAVNDNALAWHSGEDGKANALNVIAVWTSEALAGRLHPTVAALSATATTKGEAE